MAVARWLETDTYSNKDISSAVSIGVYTADADRFVLPQLLIDQAVGNGDYVYYVTLQVNGAGSSYVFGPKTTSAAASGETAIGAQGGPIFVRSGDVLTVYVDGLAGDNSTPDTIVRWAEMAALRPTTADRTLDVSAGGEAGVDWGNVGSPTTTVNLSGTSTKANETAPLDAAGTRGALGMAAADLDTQLDAILEDTGTTLPAQITDIQARIPAALVGGRMDADAGAISGDETAADNLETMLDGTGGATLTLKKLYVNNPDSAPAKAVEILGNTGVYVGGTDRGVYLEGGTNQALYMASAYASATIYVEGPSDGTGSAIAISSPGSSPAGTRASGQAIKIETEDAHPAIRVDFAAVGGDVMDIKDSDNGNWVWDDTIGQLDDGAITAAKFDGSTAFPLTQADAGATAIARTGADSDTLEALSDQIDGVSAGSGLTAQQTRDAMKLAPSAGAPAAGSVDAHLDAIQAQTDTIDDIKAVTDALDISAVTHVTVNDAGALTITRTLSFSTTISALTIPADWEACYWTVKRSTDDPDAEALVQILESNPGDDADGVQVLAGEAVEDGVDGSLTVNQAGGTVAIALGDASTALLEDAVELVWDVKFHYPAGKTQPGTGTATITTAVTRA